MDGKVISVWVFGGGGGRRGDFIQFFGFVITEQTHGKMETICFIQ